MIRVLIVEDNPIYMALLKNKLRDTNLTLQAVNSAYTVKEARKLIDEQQPNVLILDINLKGETIFELFEYIDYKNFEIIFATGSGEYAITAFDVEAIGYLVKPVAVSQLKKFLLIAQSNIKAKPEEKLPASSFLSYPKQAISNKTISVPFEDGFDIIPISKIQRCEAINATTHIFMDDGKKLVSAYNLGKFSNLLIGKGFYLAHRSHIINLSFVKKYLRSGIIIMQDLTEIPLSKANRQEFISFFSDIDRPN